MRRSRAFLSVLLALTLSAPLALAYPEPKDAPSVYASECLQKYDRRFVYDFANALERDIVSEVEDEACQLYNQTGAHFVLVTVQNTEKEPLENYALHLFEKWGIGEKDRNDGILLLYVKDYQRDGKPSAVRIEVGYGLTGVVNSLVSRDTIDAMRETKQNELVNGSTDAEATSFALGVGSLVLLYTLEDQYTDGHFPTPTSTPFSGALGVPTWVWFVGILIIILVIMALATSARGRGGGGSGWAYYPGSSHWSSGLGGAFIGGRGGFGGGGFGGGGFGGGRSGGGGGSGGF